MRTACRCASFACKVRACHVSTFPMSSFGHSCKNPIPPRVKRVAAIVFGIARMIVVGVVSEVYV